MNYRPQPPLITGEETDRKHIISKRQEKKVKKKSKGKLTIGSGNKGIKGDIVGFTAKRKRKTECKTTDKTYIKIKREWLEKLERQAYEDDSEPVLVFGFSNIEFGSYDWGAVPYDRLEELFEIEKKYYELLGKNY